jgi:hypothetical protein
MQLTDSLPSITSVSAWTQSFQSEIGNLCSSNPCHMLMLVEIQQKLVKAPWKSSYAILPKLFGFEDSNLLECYIISTVNSYGEA